MSLKQDVMGVIQKMDENHEIGIAWDGKEQILELKIKCLAKDLKKRNDNKN